jgi:hypothetical protein
MNFLEISIEIVWGNNKDECEDNFKNQFGKFKRWKLLNHYWKRTTVHGTTIVMIAYSFPFAE